MSTNGKEKTKNPSLEQGEWYDENRAKEIVEAYNRGAGSAQPADEFLATSIIPAGTGALRDFSYISPELPEFLADSCVACMECVQNCPDTAILGKVIREDELEKHLATISNESQRKLIREQTVRSTKFYKTYQKKHEQDSKLPPGALFGIFIDPTKCKGCGECVEVCGDHGALKMIKKTPDNLPGFFNMWESYRKLPESPGEYVSPKLLTDIMLKEKNLGYVGGAGSCMGCGEASVLRQWIAATSDVHGNKWGIVAATGCNTVYGSTYPYNPYRVPWTNSLFENAPADAMGIRAFWDEGGHDDWPLWVIGGDGAMFDIGFQSLSRMLASGMNVKVLVMDTQVYSNTAGQTSTASFMGQEAKMSAFGKKVMGKPERRKELFQLAMMHNNTFVAQTVGPMINHFVKAVQRANEYKGPAVIVTYTTCQPEHGVGDDMAAAQARLAVQSRAFPMAVYDPEKGDTIRERLSLMGNPSVDRDWCIVKEKDGTERQVTFLDFAKSEMRFIKHFDKDGKPSQTILNSMKDRLENWWQLQELAGIVNKDREERKAAQKK